MIANSKLQILRGEQTTTPLGDTEDTDRVVGEVVGYVRDFTTRRDKNSAASSDTDAQARVPMGTDARVGDRVVTSSGATYVIRGRQRAALVNKAILLDLERISGSQS